MTDLRYHRHYAVVLGEDHQETMRKDTEYQGSWMRRGGVGAFMMLARKWDRIEGLLGPHHLNIMSAIQADYDSDRVQGSDGTVIAEVRDLRRYLLNVEAYAIQQGWVELPTGRGMGGAWSDMYSELRAALKEELGVEVVYDETGMHLQRGPTPAQEAMARDRAATAPRPPVSEAPGSPLATLPAASEAAPATVAPPPVPEALATFEPGDRVKCLGWTEYAIVDSADTTNIGGDLIYVRWPGGATRFTVHKNDVVLHERIVVNIADAGGPIVLAEDEPVLPSQEERNPISATWAEWETIRKRTIQHGTLRGKTWGSVYHSVAGRDGRYDMLLDCQEEYGR